MIVRRRPRWGLGQLMNGYTVEQLDAFFAELMKEPGMAGTNVGHYEGYAAMWKVLTGCDYPPKPGEPGGPGGPVVSPTPEQLARAQAAYAAGRLEGQRKYALYELKRRAAAAAAAPAVAAATQAMYAAQYAAAGVTPTIQYIGARPSGAAGAAAYYPTVSVSNLTRPGQPFQVDDELLVQIGGGRPNAAVTATATHDGSTSTSSFGNTDSGGFFQVRKRMTNAEIGTWQQTWKVGTEEASPRLSFSVVAKPTTTTAGAAAGGGAAAGEGEKKETAAPALLDQIKAVPWWVWAVAAGLIALVGARPR